MPFAGAWMMPYFPGKIFSEILFFNTEGAKMTRYFHIWLLLLISGLTGMGGELLPKDNLSGPELRHILPPRRAVDLVSGIPWDYAKLKFNTMPDESTRWKQIEVPCDMYIRDGESGFFRTCFQLRPEEIGKTVLLKFRIVCPVGEVFLNGKAVKLHFDYTLPFECDISRYVKAGENILLVRHSNVKDMGKEFDGDNIPSVVGWSHVGRRGVSGPVHLEITDPLHIRDIGVQTLIAGGKRLRILATVRNNGRTAKSCRIQAAVGSEWRTESPVVTVPPGAERELELFKAWENPKLWSPDTPHLYSADILLLSEGKTVDAYRQRFGFREISIKGNHLFLNGYPFINRRSSDSPDVGMDMIARGSTSLPRKRASKSVLREQLRRLRARGYVGIRSGLFELCEISDACDEVGILISPLASVGSWGKTKTDRWWKLARIHEENMVRTFRNHPSVIYWGISNEFGTIYGGRGVEKILTPKQVALGEFVQKLDPTRFWTAYGECDLGDPVSSPGPAPVRSYHYPVNMTYGGRNFPSVNYWYPDGVNLEWQGKFSHTDKPLMISEDLYHGMFDNFFCMAKWQGDTIYTPRGLYDAMFTAIRMFAEGYYRGGIGSWEPWCAFPFADSNPLFADGRQPMPDFLIAMREQFPNFRSGASEQRKLYVYQQTFLPREITLIREDSFRGKTFFTDRKTFRMLPGSCHEETIAVRAPEGREFGVFSIKYTMKEGDKTLAGRTFSFTVIPESGRETPRGTALLANPASPMRSYQYPAGTGEKAGEVIAGKPEIIVVDKELSAEEGRLLNRYVEQGGKVLYLNASLLAWKPLQTESSASKTYVFRRNEEVLPGLPPPLFRWWRPGYVLNDVSYLKEESVPMEVLFDTFSQRPDSAAAILRYYRGKGVWLLCQLRIPSALNQEPAAGFVFEKLLAELEKPVKPFRRTAACADDDYRKFLVRNGFKIGTDPAKADLVIVRASEKLSDEQRASIFSHSRRGKTVLVAELSGKNPELIDQLGLTLSPSRAEFLTRTHNKGILAGLSNDLLSYTKLTDFFFYFRGEVIYPHYRLRNLKDPATFGSLAPKKAGSAEVLIEPGAMLAIRNGSGTILVSTIRWSELSVSYSRRVLFFLRNLFGNLGIRSGTESSGGMLTCLNLKPYMNRSFWADPQKRRGYSLARPWFDNGNDMRYFPVNLCGWSPYANNACPVEKFPTDPVYYGGIKFLLVDPLTERRDGAGVLVLFPGQRFGMPLSGKLSRVHFLGATRDELPSGTPVLAFSVENKGDSDWRSKKQLFRFGDHLGAYTGESSLRNGKIGWRGHSQTSSNAALYVWSGDNSSSSGTHASFFTLENISTTPVAVIAVTAEYQ